MNEKYVENAVRDYLSPIKITKDAFNKANIISQRVCALANKPLEIGFYLIDDSLIGREPNITINDIYIGKEQNVRYEHCDITPIGKYNSIKDIKSMNKRIVGWGHSHGHMDTFYSREDDETILRSLKRFGINKSLEIMNPSFELNKEGVSFCKDKNAIEIQINDEKYLIYSDSFKDHSSEYYTKNPFFILREKNEIVPFFYGMTFNAKNSEPHCVIAYSYRGINNKIEDGIDYRIVDNLEKIDLSIDSIDREISSRVIEIREQIQNKEQDFDLELKKLRSEYINVCSNLKQIKNRRGIFQKDLDLENICEIFESIKEINEIKNRNAQFENSNSFNLENKDKRKYENLNLICESINKKVSERKEDINQIINHYNKNERDKSLSNFVCAEKIKKIKQKGNSLIKSIGFNVDYSRERDDY